MRLAEVMADFPAHCILDDSLTPLFETLSSYFPITPLGTWTIRASARLSRGCLKKCPERHAEVFTSQGRQDRNYWRRSAARPFRGGCESWAQENGVAFFWHALDSKRRSLALDLLESRYLAGAGKGRRSPALTGRHSAHHSGWPTLPLWWQLAHGAQWCFCVVPLTWVHSRTFRILNVQPRQPHNCRPAQVIPFLLDASNLALLAGLGKQGPTGRVLRPGGSSCTGKAKTSKPMWMLPWPKPCSRCSFAWSFLAEHLWLVCEGLSCHMGRGKAHISVSYGLCGTVSCQPHLKQMNQLLQGNGSRAQEIWTAGSAEVPERHLGDCQGSGLQYEDHLRRRVLQHRPSAFLDSRVARQTAAAALHLELEGICRPGMHRFTRLGPFHEGPWALKFQRAVIKFPSSQAPAAPKELETARLG